jgi:WD40 repeat protein
MQRPCHLVRRLQQRPRTCVECLFPGPAVASQSPTVLSNELMQPYHLGRRLHQSHSSWVNAFAFSQDGKALASVSSDEPVRLWDVTAGAWKQTLKGHSNLVEGVIFSPDGKVFASASSDKTVRLWEATTGACKLILEGHSSFVNTIKRFLHQLPLIKRCDSRMPQPEPGCYVSKSQLWSLILFMIIY